MTSCKASQEFVSKLEAEDKEHIAVEVRFALELVKLSVDHSYRADITSL